MKWDDVAPTITSGCHNPSKGRFIHPEEHRPITLREAALLQGFPSSYRFDIAHGKESIALMIGNALPPPFIKAQSKAMLTSIKKNKSGIKHEQNQ
jgi:DNA (cytosine-5)-methyltransferase 1